LAEAADTLDPDLAESLRRFVHLVRHIGHASWDAA
jgi:hypothetical protein